MAKKTSRAARVQQSTRQQDIKRELSARPLHLGGADNTSGGRTAVAPEPLRVSISAHDLADASTPSVADVEKTGNAPEPIPAITRPISAATAIPRPASGSPVLPRRFLNAQPKQSPVISREEEYRFIRADLVTVLVLAILMVIALVILTIVIGR